MHKYKIQILTVLTLLLAGSIRLVPPTWADSGAGKVPNNRKKSLDFDDELVEGMNKRPLDSLNQISEKDKRRRRPHLYRKRTSYDLEIAKNLKELGFVQ